MKTNFLSLGIASAQSTCADPAAKQICESSCLDGYTECVIVCEPEDIVCKSQCTREFTVCENDCPCGDNCPAGCEGCATWECSCETIGHNHLDALDCRTDAEYRFSYCKAFSCHNASDSIACEEECFYIYNEEIQHCPCAPYCPDGCPCDNYMCVQGTSTTIPPETSPPDVTGSTTAAETTIPPHEHPHTNFLVLNSYVEHKALAFEWLRSEPEPTVDLLDGLFEFEEPISIINSCSVTLGGVMYVLGGSTNPTQIAVVEGCGVVSAGELTEPVDGGLCTTFYDEDEHAIICSPTTKSRACLNFTPEEGFKPGDNKKEYPDTEEQHHGGAIVLNEGMPMIIAGGQTLKTELLEKNKGVIGPNKGNYIWTGKADLPGAHHRDGLSAVNYYGTIYAFGGQGRFSGTAECSYYTQYHWEDCKQKMTAPRFGHRSVVDADTIIHFGGNYAGSELNVPLERWAHAVGHFTIDASNSTFDNYFSYPEMFHLDTQLTCE